MPPSATTASRVARASRSRVMRSECLHISIKMIKNIRFLWNVETSNVDRIWRQTRSACAASSSRSSARPRPSTWSGCSGTSASRRRGVIPPATSPASSRTTSTSCSNAEKQGFAAGFAKKHGPAICSMGWRVDDPARALEEATKRGAREAKGADLDHPYPAIYGIGDSLIYFIGSFAGSLDLRTRFRRPGRAASPARQGLPARRPPHQQRARGRA